MNGLYALTDSMIVQTLNTHLEDLTHWYNYVGIIIVIVIFIMDVRNKLQGVIYDKKTKIGLVVVSCILICIFDLPIFLKKRAIEYALEREAWTIKEDVVYDIGRKISLREHEDYVVYFENSGKLQTTKYEAHKYKKGENVYLIIVRYGFGKEYIIAHENRGDYYYKNAIPFDENIRNGKELFEKDQKDFKFDVVLIILSVIAFGFYNEKKRKNAK